MCFRDSGRYSHPKRGDLIPGPLSKSLKTSHDVVTSCASLSREYGVTVVQNSLQMSHCHDNLP